MKWVIILVLVLASGYFAYLAFKAKQSNVAQQREQQQPAPPTKKDWKHEDIAKDPQGYLVWSQQQVAEQIKGREQRLAQLSDRRSQFVGKQSALFTKMKEVENFHNRLKAALQRAEDEDRWPVRMAGTVYERAKAQELIQLTRTWVDERQGLADAYNASLKKMDDSANVLRSDITQLAQLNDKLALDLERLKIDQSMADLNKLRQAENQLASMSKTLSQISDEEAPVLPASAKTNHVDINAIVK
jgi:uncharacterized phage infection (PIP) family protein YhgE